MTYVELAAGLVLLVLGGDLLVRGAVGLARHLGVSSLLIGLTVVGFGTSMPELVTSVQAALVGSPGIAVGNVVGSNIANILLIIALTAVIYPMAIARAAIVRDGTVMMLATFALVAIVIYGFLSREVGLGLVAALVTYVFVTYLRERVTADASAALHAAEGEQIHPAPGGVTLSLLFAIGGLVLTILGARLLVGSAIELARIAGISETIVGLTIVAVGTSLPELVTCIIAAVRKEADVAFGNIVGSNIYNILGILGVTAAVQPIPIPAEIVSFDIWVVLAASILLVLFAFTQYRLSRWEGLLLFAAYCGYVSYLAAGVL